MSMKVRDLLPQEIDIDVCDDYDESCYVAFCGPMKLTEEGEKYFAKALDLEIKIGDIITVCCGDDEDEAEKNVIAACKLFYSMAGCCDVEDYERWFVEND